MLATAPLVAVLVEQVTAVWRVVSVLAVVVLFEVLYAPVFVGPRRRGLGACPLPMVEVGVRLRSGLAVARRPVARRMVGPVVPALARLVRITAVPRYASRGLLKKAKVAIKERRA